MNQNIHLQRLLAAEVEEPWYRSFFKNLKGAIRRPTSAAEVTSKPVPAGHLEPIPSKRNAPDSAHCAMPRWSDRLLVLLERIELSSRPLRKR